MVASLGDVADWATALYGGTVLDAATREELTASPLDMGGGLGYGLGTMIAPASITGGAGPGVGHGGDIFGYHALTLYFPDRQAAIAAVVNSDADDVNEVFVAGLLTLFP
jgi:hypothetical protein